MKAKRILVAATAAIMGIGVLAAPAIAASTPEPVVTQPTGECVDYEWTLTPGSIVLPEAEGVRWKTGDGGLAPTIEYPDLLNVTKDFQYVSAGGTHTISATVNPAPEAEDCSPPEALPQGLLDDNLAPTTVIDSDKVSVELGLKFTPTADGIVTAVQFYRGNSAMAVGSVSVWSSSGQRLATKAVSGNATGWNEVALTTPLIVEAGKTYTVSYLATAGRYPSRTDLKVARTVGDLKAPANSGVYKYGNGFPAATFNGSNYMVDVVFYAEGGAVVTPTPTPTPTEPEVTPTPTPTPTEPEVTPTPTPAPTPTDPPVEPGECIGAANTPGGADPWGGCWPGPQNTGYPHGVAGDTRTPVTLTNYTGATTIRSCGVVIDSKIVSQDLIIEAGTANVKDLTKPCITIRNSLVKGVIFAEQDRFGPVVVQDTTVDPNGLSWWENIGRSNILVERVDSQDSEGVVKCDSNCIVRDSWVHGMRLGGAYHYNAVGGNGTDKFLIEHNYLSCGDWTATDPGVQGDAGCSAVIGFYGDYAPATNITINKNFLISTYDMGAGRDRQAGYCLNPGYYPGKPYGWVENTTITNNVFARGQSGKCGVFGPTNSLNKAGQPRGNVWDNNRYSDGMLIGRPEE